MNKHIPKDYREWVNQRTFEITIHEPKLRHETCRFYKAESNQDYKLCRQCQEEDLHEQRN
jgi:hypothetical protein